MKRTRILEFQISNIVNPYRTNSRQYRYPNSADYLRFLVSYSINSATSFSWIEHDNS